MKKSLVYIAILLSVLSCSNEEDTVIPVEKSYGDPTVKLEEFKQQILSSTHGWNAVLESKAGKVYKLFFDFNLDGGVIIYADANATTASSSPSTTYRIEISQQVNPSLFIEGSSTLDLIPEKYTAIDKDYTYKYTDGDSLYLLGNRHGDKLTFIKATAEEKEDYVAGKLKGNIENITTYLSSVHFLYAELETDKTIQLVLDQASRDAFVTYVDENVKFSGSKYFYSSNGISLVKPLSIYGYVIKDLLWDSDTQELYTIYNESRINFRISAFPVIPLHYLLGIEYSSNLELPSPYAVGLLNGWSDKFISLWVTDDLAVQELNIQLYYVNLNIHVADNTMSLDIYYLENAVEHFISLPYTFSKSEGVYTFSPLPVDLTDREQEIIDRISNIIGVVNENSFTIDYFNIVYANNREYLIAKLTCVEDNEIYFTAL